jgi:hypothetical protein
MTHHWGCSCVLIRVVAGWLWRGRRYQGRPMHIYTHIHIFMYICICIYIYIHIYMHIYTYTYTYTYIHTYTYIRTQHTHTHKHTHTCSHAHTHTVIAQHDTRRKPCDLIKCLSLEYARRSQAEETSHASKEVPMRKSGKWLFFKKKKETGPQKKKVTGPQAKC